MMAGSYGHITDKDGKFIGVELLDHLGDAHGALEQCIAMINYLSGGDKQKIFGSYKHGYCEKHIPKENMSMITFESFWDRD
jgi:hypothetical protein